VATPGSGGGENINVPPGGIEPAQTGGIPASFWLTLLLGLVAVAALMGGSFVLSLISNRGSRS
jgi:hypothetical protein